MKILIVEDKAALADAIKEYLTMKKMDVTVSYDGLEGFKQAKKGVFDVIVLDLMLPNKDGVSIIKDLRSLSIKSPILVLTAKASTEDKVECLLDGADDYLTKPFVLEELLARIVALSRRVSNVQNTNEMTYADLTLNRLDHSIRCGKNTIALSQKEFSILEVMLERIDENIEKSYLMEKVWNVPILDNNYNSVEVYVSFLRKKLEFIKSKVHIRSVRAFGYKIVIDD